MQAPLQTTLTRDYDAIALYSGGTDSTLAPILARPVVGDNVLLLMVDLGESPESISQASERAKVLNWTFELVTGVAEFAREMLTEAIRFRGSYWGYPLGTPLGRAYQCQIASAMLAQLHDLSPRRRYLIHGCSARQNTRFRIERSCDTVYDVFPFGPLVTSTLSREEKVRQLEENGIPTGPSDDIARDENIFCRALEGDALNNLRDPDRLNLYSLVVDIDKTPDASAQTTIGFESGAPVSLDGQALSIQDVVIACRDLGAEHGIGRICVFEDTVPELGYKERSLFESPASALLYTAHQYLESATLNRAERELMRSLRHDWADLVYRGFWDTAERSELATLSSPLQNKLNGTVTLKLFKGAVAIGDADIPDALMIKPGQLAGTY